MLAAGAYVPLGQATHASLPDWPRRALKEPAGHGMIINVPGHHDPTGHTMQVAETHVVRFVSAVVLAGHAMQAPTHPPAQYVLPTHGMQLALDASRKAPAPQVVAASAACCRRSPKQKESSSSSGSGKPSFLAAILSGDYLGCIIYYYVLRITHEASS